MDNKELHQIDNILRLSLSEFVRDIFIQKWKGREREAVSLYAFGYLCRHFQDGHVLSDFTQICIEGCVPSSKKLGNPKGRVNRDLILWRKPKMTCWNEEWKIVNQPLVIMEWKVIQPKNQKKPVIEWENENIPWLQKYTETYSDTAGYAVLLNLLNEKLNVARLYKGTLEHDWLRI